jgi:transposase
MLKAAGFDVWLVDGRQTKQVPGRKTDVKDCQWILQLHSYGLLNRCFVPEPHIKELRSYNRLREDHIRSASMHVNHMQKALTEMNIRLKEVISQIHGVSGLAIIRAILAGERDAHKLLELCHESIKIKKSEQVLKSLKGFYTPSGVFALQQAYTAYNFYKNQIEECDERIEEVMKRINHSDNELTVEKRKPIRHNKPNVENLGGHLLKIFAEKDATKLPGITDYTWLQLLTEIGNDLTKWPSEKHFTSWLGLAPGQHQSGKMNKRKNRKFQPKAGQVFRNIAQSLIESKKIALGAFGRRLKSRKGAGIAVKATANKLAKFYWRLMVKGMKFTEHGIKAYEEKMMLQKEKWLIKTANQLGIKLSYNQSLI